MASKTESLEMLIWQIRRVFHLLASRSGELLKDMNINPSQRAVLEFLTKEEKQTVPAIARQYDVSRQHIQQIVNELLEKGLVETTYNPAHKRSVFLQLTRAGRAVFETIQHREAQLLAQISRHFSLKDMQTVQGTLTRLSELLRS